MGWGVRLGEERRGVSKGGGARMSGGLVSVIVPTKNSAGTIEMCLKSIKEQTYPDIEIIVVDNYSEDGTAEIARKYAQVFVKGPERSTQRNHGAENAKGNYLVFIDSDMELTSTVIEECVHEIVSDDIGAVVIPEISVGEGFWTRCKALERSCYIGDDTIEAARFFDKNVFQKMKGYDETIAGGGEDWDLPQRVKIAGYKIGRIDSLIKHNEGRLSLLKTMNKKYYYAKTIRNYMKKHPEMAKKQLVLIRPAFIRHWQHLACDPIYTVGFIFMKCCEFGAASLGYFFFRSKRENYYYNNNLISNANELPFVSFIIPTFNAEPYLEKCLKSIKMQDYPKNKMEVLVIDGGSDDNTIIIASKYKAKILDNPRKNAESGKSIGISHSNGEIVAFVDSDNEIAQDNWLSKMVVPLVSDQTIAGVESQYLIKDDFSMINRYCARMKIVDPLARILASKPSIVNIGTYSILNYKKNSNPIIGANGFLWRKNIILSLSKNTRTFEEANFVSIVVNSGYTKFAAVPNIGIYHYYSNNIRDFIKKRVKIGNKFLLRKKGGKSTWLDSVNKIKFAFAIAYCATFIGPTLEALYQFMKTRDISWFLHPVISFITILAYGKVYLAVK